MQMQNDQNATAKDKITSYLYISSIYFVTVGILYLWGYWAPFNVNILEYLSFSDILKSTAYPIVSAFLFSAIGIFLGDILGVGKKSLPAGEGKNTLEGKFLNKHIRKFIFLYLIMTASLWIWGPIEKWNATLPMLIAIPLAFIVKRTGLLASDIPNEDTRSSVIFMLVLLLPIAYGHGRLKAAKILDGNEYQYVVSPIDGLSLNPNSTTEQRPRFLGQAGDYLFLFNPTLKSILIMKFDQARILNLNNFARSPTLVKNLPHNHK